MNISGNIFNLKAGVIEVFAAPNFNMILRNTIWEAMKEKARRDRRFKTPKLMVVELL